MLGESQINTMCRAVSSGTATSGVGLIAGGDDTVPAHHVPSPGVHPAAPGREEQTRVHGQEPRGGHGAAVCRGGDRALPVPAHGAPPARALLSAELVTRRQQRGTLAQWGAGAAVVHWEVSLC